MHNPLTRKQNAIVDRFNTKHHLPRLTVMILDKEILQMIGSEEAGLTKEIERCIQYLATDLRKNIDTQLEWLDAKKPGAIANTDTDIIWCEMIERPCINYTF